MCVKLFTASWGASSGFPALPVCTARWATYKNSGRLLLWYLIAFTLAFVNTLVAYCPLNCQAVSILWRKSWPLNTFPSGNCANANCITNWLHVAESFWTSHQSVRTSQPKLHYGVHKSASLVYTFSQMNVVHTIPFYSHFSKICFNIILPPIRTSSWCSPSYWLSHVTHICITLLPIYATYLSHLILFDLIILITLARVGEN
jgi:hypothetical protein